MTPRAAKSLKWLRVAMSALFLTLVTAGAVGVPAVLEGITTLAWRVQIIPSLLAMSLGTFIFWFIVTLLFGRIYCSTVCPIGTLQDIVARLRRRRIYRFTPSRLHFAIFMMVVTAAAAFAGFKVVVKLLDPASEYTALVREIISPTLLASIVGAFNLIMVLLAVALAWKGGRLFCNTICPVGGALSIVSRTSLFHIEINPDKCIRCRKCVDVCKAECIEIDTCVVDNARCVICFNCLTVCPNEAINYRSDRQQLSTPMFQRILPKVNTSMNNETVLRTSRPHPQKRS